MGVGTVTAVVLLLFLGYFLFTVASTEKELDLYVALINSSSTEEKENKVIQALAGLLECESQDDIVLDSSYFIHLDGMDPGSQGAIQRLLTGRDSRKLDLLIAGEEEFHYLVKQGLFMDLAEALPTDVYSRLCDRIYLDASEKASSEAKAYGIRLEGLRRFEQLGTGMESPVLGIAVNTKNQKNSVKALKYLTK